MVPVIKFLRLHPRKMLEVPDQMRLIRIATVETQLRPMDLFLLMQLLHNLTEFEYALEIFRG